jgi:Mg-chelatase subunit ChlD
MDNTVDVAAVPSLDATFHTEYKTYPASGTCTVKACLQLEANLVNKSTRKRLTEDEIQSAISSNKRKKIMFVLDTSDSMAPNIFMLKQIMNKVADSVKGDHIGIVTFDTETRVIYPLKSVATEEDRSSLRQNIKNLRTGGCTDLCAGILKGMDVLWEEKDQKESERRFMVILTDGVTNSGITNVLKILEQLDKKSNMDKTDVYCMALGSQVNQDLLQTIVMEHSGRLYALSSPHNLSQTFGDCMGSIMSTLFTDVKIGFFSHFPIYTSFRGKTSKKQTTDERQCLEVELGTMFIGDTRDVMVTFELPLEHTNPSIGSIMVLYNHQSIMGGSDASAFEPIIMPVTVEFDHYITQPQRPNPYVIRQQLRLCVASILEEMSMFSQEENVRETLKQRAKNIEDEIHRLGWQEDPLCQELLANLTRMPSMPPLLCRAASVGLANQRQSSVMDAADSSALYTTSLQRSLSSQYACGDANVSHDADEDLVNGLPSMPPRLGR